MKILDAHVVDPRTAGKYVDPYIELKVDEFVEETDEPRYRDDMPGLRIIPCGPFTAVEEMSGIGWTDELDLGKFNALAFHREQLIGVQVVTPEETLPLALGVQRARRLLRKHCSEYHILPSEPAALQARILWRVEKVNPKCFQCSLAPVQTVWYGGAHVPLCRRHFDQHTSRVRRETMARA